MADSTREPGNKGPDLRKGIDTSMLDKKGTLLGHVDEDDVLLIRSAGKLFAVSPLCTHYSGQLAEGLVVGETVRCPLHHACFSLGTGEAMRAPAFAPLSRWNVEQKGDRVLVGDKIAASPVSREPAQSPDSVAIIGGGAAGMAAADMLRREGYGGKITIISGDDTPPYDRPNLSKDYLGGEMPADWLPLQPLQAYAERKIDLLLDTRVTSIDTAGRRLELDHGVPLEYSALLIATGAEPVHLPVPGAEHPRVHYLRTLADSQAILDRAESAKTVFIIGASFIGLEVAASLRQRGIGVHVAAPETLPLEKILGSELGGLVKRIHESHGVVFHLGESVARIDDRTVTLTGGSALDADFVVMGVGVRPSVALADKAGLKMNKGVVVDEYLETSTPGIFAAGDIARWPDPHTGDDIRVEHWVVAERQGQIAAKNILGKRKRFDALPFFWSQHYDITIRYVGHAGSWDEVRIDGSLDGPPEKVNCSVSYLRGGKRLAIATIARDRESLEAELEMEAE